LQLTAKTFQGLEPVLAKEIENLGGTNIQIHKRAVSYEGDQKLLYRSCYELRTALRILKPFHQFKTKHENHLYKKMREVDWVSKFGLEQTFVINAVTSSKYITHSKYLALKSKDAIVDTFREVYDRQRPSIDRRNPDFRLNIHLGWDNVCTLAWDASGESLHKRGYRMESVEAPINEVLAAGMVLLSNWDQSAPLIDPMCGSGTILIEAAMLACNIPPQRNRQHFGFMKWEDYDKDLWRQVKQEAKERIQTVPSPILGYDKDFEAIKASMKNILAAQLEDAVTVERMDFNKQKQEYKEGVLITNPPYDERLEEEDIYAFYKDMGHVLKHKFEGFDAWLISSNIKAMKKLGLKPSKKNILFNGALECQFNCYELYKGSKK